MLRFSGIVDPRRLLRAASSARNMWRTCAFLAGHRRAGRSPGHGWLGRFFQHRHAVLNRSSHRRKEQCKRFFNSACACPVRARGQFAPILHQPQSAAGAQVAALGAVVAAVFADHGGRAALGALLCPPSPVAHQWRWGSSSSSSGRRCCIGVLLAARQMPWMA